MFKIAGAGAQMAEEQENEEAVMVKPSSSWKADIDRKRRQIDYKDIFDEDEPNGSLSHSIFFWLADKATLDKGMCAAVHAVGLRNHLNASCRFAKEARRADSGTRPRELCSRAETTLSIFQVQIGMGFIELPQVEMDHGAVKQDMLDTKGVFILDSTSDIFLWTGKKADRLLNMAGQGEESIIFKSKFVGWNDVNPCDFTRTADSVQRRGADVKVIMERDKMKTDLAALFLDRQPPMSYEESEELLQECNEDLELIESSILVLSEDDIGSDDGSVSDAGKVVRMHQQQENHMFLAHFKKKFVIRRGRSGLTKNLGGHWPELFQMRANGSSMCTRTIQIDCRSDQLCSAFCFILRAPYRTMRDDGEKGRVFVWIGKQSDEHERPLVKEIADELIGRDDESFPIEVDEEDQEPEEMWEYLGGKKKYETNGDFVAYTRLFRCKNEKGYFSISEKTVDFCQDDLDDDDIMIVDNGDLVTLWIGPKSSEVELKLAYKAAQMYIAHLRMKQTDRPRKLVATFKGKETKKLKKCFHAWGKHKITAGDA